MLKIVGNGISVCKVVINFVGTSTKARSTKTCE